MTEPVIAMTIAGSDSGGGAGIQADLKTFAAFGVYGTSTITAVTAQNTVGVQAIHAVPVGVVVAQIRSVLSDMDVCAIKIGMLASAEIVMAVADELAASRARPIVLDPVMVATSGDRLIAPDAVDALRRTLMPRATCLTPNLHEAALLTGMPVATSLPEMEAQAMALLAFGARAVLVKGGHRDDGCDAVDVLATADGLMHVGGPRIDTANTHGTGCSLSAAIAAGLALGHDIADAVVVAKRWLTGALVAARTHRLGAGHGPVHHFHDVTVPIRPVRA